MCALLLSLFPLGFYQGTVNSSYCRWQMEIVGYFCKGEELSAKNLLKPFNESQTALFTLPEIEVQVVKCTNKKVWRGCCCFSDAEDNIGY